MGKQREAVLKIPEETIREKIYQIRGRKVMLDSDLAALYEVKTKSLNLAVKRNETRFPEDFMFQLTEDEFERLRHQFETSKQGRGGRRYLPYAFTEQGVAMLSSVLNSERAVQVNIQIIRAFTKIREMLQVHKVLWRKIEEMEKKYDENFRVVFKALKELLEPPERPKPKIGFHP